jgi:hypothetical protein
VDGLDEENCDMLEFNECKDNEFRQQDCMDRNDEIAGYKGSACPILPSAFDCDDHICPNLVWSCGDGQCVDSYTRHMYHAVPDENLITGGFRC